MKKRTLWLCAVLILCVLLCACTAAPQQQGENPSDSSSENAASEPITTPQDDFQGSETPEDTSASATEQNGTATEPAPSQSEEGASVTESTEPNALEERLSAEYLAAASIMAVSLEYPTFEPRGMYINAEEDNIYFLFINEGQEMTLHVYPLERERNQSGTVDLCLQDRGVFAFDVTQGAADVSALKEMPDESYGALLQSVEGLSLSYH